MWQKTHSKLYNNISKETIWKLWTDVNNWHFWHSDLDYCKLEGPFEVGNHFLLKPKGHRPVKIQLTDIDPFQSFTDCTQFLGAKMYDTHSLQETPDGLLLTNTLTVTGPLKWLWIKLVAQNVADTVPSEMDALVQHAQKAYE